MPDAQICVILNAGSGKKSSDDIADQIREAFRAEGSAADLRMVRKSKHLMEEIRKAAGAGYGTVVAAGGDGTISAVADVLHGTDVAMGLIPLGTFNYFARSLGIPATIPEAVRIVAGGTTRKVPVATVNGQAFLNNCSLGTYPEILRRREAIYKKWGRSRLAAYWSAIVTLATRRKPMLAKFTLDDGTVESFRSTIIFAINNAYQLDELGLEGREAVAAGRLVIFLAPDDSRWGMLVNTLAIATGLARRERHFRMVSGADVTLETVPSHRLVARDGEKARMKGPYRLRVSPDDLSVLVPADAVGDVR